MSIAVRRRKFWPNVASSPERARSWRDLRNRGTRMIASLLLHNMIYVVLMGVVLFAVRRHAALARRVGLSRSPPRCLGRPAAGGLPGSTRPCSPSARGRSFRRISPTADKLFMLAFVLAVLIWLVAMGLERRMQALGMPPALQAIGFAMYIASTLFILWVYPRKHLCSARRQGTGRARSSCGLHRTLCIRAPSDV